MFDICIPFGNLEFYYTLGCPIEGLNISSLLNFSSLTTCHVCGHTCCWKLISSCVTTWEWILQHPILLLLFSCILSHMSLPSTAFSPYLFIVRSLSCEYYAPHWNLWCWDKASDLGLPPKNPPLPQRAVMQRLGACHAEIADVASDSIHHAKPFLDFNFSVFSLSWSWRK